MARPIKTFTEFEASHIVNVLRLRQLTKGYLFTNDMRKGANEGAGLDELKRMFERVDPATPDSVRAWIDTYMSPEGWTRVQAAMRQHKKQIGRPDQLTLMSRNASSQFGQHAENCGATKKDYLDALAAWLTYDEAGQAFVLEFAKTLKKS